MDVASKDIGAVLVDVRRDVLQETNGNQVPWEHTSLTGQVFLHPVLPAPSAAAPPPSTGALPPGRNYDKEMEIALWNAVKDSKSPDVLQTYLDRFPDGTFSGLARILMDRLRSPATAPAPPPASAQAPVPTTNPAALARALQTELKRVGCDPGNVNGTWGRQAEEALEEFARRTKISLPGNKASQAALEAVAGRQERVCVPTCGSGETASNGKCVAREKPKSRRPAVAETPRRKPSTGGGASSGKAGPGLCWTMERSQLVACNNPNAVGGRVN
jgi:hypothetical protein